jgi:hypothetical protein
VKSIVYISNLQPITGGLCSKGVPDRNSVAKACPTLVSTLIMHLHLARVLHHVIGNLLDVSTRNAPSIESRLERRA